MFVNVPAGMIECYVALIYNKGDQISYIVVLKICRLRNYLVANHH